MREAKMKARLLIVAALVVRAAPALGQLSALGAAVLDSNGQQRTSFSDNERLTLQQKVFNGSASSQRIQFRFVLLGPASQEVFWHSGNSVPASAGSSASQVSGIPIQGFFAKAGSGNYKLRAEASLGGQTIVQESLPFNISSSFIILTYPPNGSMNLNDNPLSFQWTSSGANRYRITVGREPSFYTNPYVAETAGQETSITYPQNPSDEKQRLVSGQIYYWKIEGLDPSGNAISRSDVPFLFSMASAPQARDLAVTVLEAGSAGPAGIPFKVGVSNQGGTLESNVQLRFSLGGIPGSGSPLVMLPLNSGDSRTYDFTAAIPPGQNDSLAVACIDIFDDNVQNNCKSLTVSRPASEGSGLLVPPGTQLSCRQVWQAVKAMLKNNPACGDVGDYEMTGGDCEGLTSEDLNALLASFSKGEGRCELTGPPQQAFQTAPPPIEPVPVQTAPPVAAAPPPAVSDLQEWSGQCLPLSEKALARVIADEKDFARAWKRMSEEALPEVDFDKQLVLSILAGKSDPAERIEIESLSGTLKGMVVRYRLFGGKAKKEAARGRTACLMKVVKKSGMDVTFDRIEEEEKDEKDMGGRVR
jgi:hypothetical protein